MKPIFKKKLRFYLQLWSAIWSLPLAMISFVGFGILIQWLFTSPGDPQGGPGFYDPSFLQAAFYASAMMVFCDVAVWLGIYFTFRHIFHYYTGHLDQDANVINPSKTDFDGLKPWQKILVLFGLYTGFTVQWIVLFMMLK